MNIRFFVISLITIALTSFSSNAQEEEMLPKPRPTYWHMESPTNEFSGIQATEAYEFLKDKKATPLIVAVIDSGTEISHPELNGSIWVNADEVPENGIDDDKNGYIDDVHGWSFIGGANGDL